MALEYDNKKDGYHLSDVEDGQSPDSVANVILCAGKPQEKYKYRLLDNGENRIIYSTNDVDPLHPWSWVEGPGHVPVVDADIQQLHHY